MTFLAIEWQWRFAMKCRRRRGGRACKGLPLSNQGSDLWHTKCTFLVFWNSWVQIHTTDHLFVLPNLHLMGVSSGTITEEEGTIQDFSGKARYRLKWLSKWDTKVSGLTQGHQSESIIMQLSLEWMHTWLAHVKVHIDCTSLQPLVLPTKGKTISLKAISLTALKI